LKKLVNLLAVAGVLVCGNAFANSLTLTLVSSTITTTPGSTVTFQATGTNTTGSTLFLNGDLPGSLDPPLTFDDSPFILLWPLSLDAGMSFGPADLFNITVPISAAAGTYNGSIEITGGPGTTDEDVIGSATFSVNVPVPEPATATFAVLGIGLLLAVRARQTSRV
jgi:hypothetical protein